MSNIKTLIDNKFNQGIWLVSILQRWTCSQIDWLHRSLQVIWVARVIRLQRRCIKSSKIICQITETEVKKVKRSSLKWIQACVLQPRKSFNTKGSTWKTLIDHQPLQASKLKWLAKSAWTCSNLDSPSSNNTNVPTKKRKQDSETEELKP